MRLVSRSFTLSILAACVGVGMLGMPALAAAGDSVSVHWAWYDNYKDANNQVVNYPTPVSDSSITAITNPTGDGVVNSMVWNNVGTKWMDVDTGATPGTNLLDSNGAATTASVAFVHPTASNWWVTGPTAGTDNLLVGPWGGDGGEGAIMSNQINGIPYSSYEIIAYVNDGAGGSDMTVWLDSDPGAPSPSNAASVQYYFHNTGTSPGFVPITNTTSGTFPLGNYAIFTGLNGATQTLWLNGTDGNKGFTGLQIVDTSAVPEPASLSLLGAGALLLISRRRK
jgi:hypothetical protein